MSSDGRKKKRGHSSSTSTRAGMDPDLSSDDLSSLPGTATYSLGDDGSLTQEPKSPRRRRRFTPTRRSEVAGVRKLGACASCRKKKISCKHALEKLNRAASPSPSTASRATDEYFESAGPDLFFNDHSRDLLHPDVGVRKHLPPGFDAIGSMESADWMLKEIATPAAHSDRIALDMHDFDTMFGDLSATTPLDTSYPGSDWVSTPYDGLSEPEALPSEPSSRSDQTHFSSLSPPSSIASDGQSMTAYRNAAQVFYCDVPRCDLRHGFAAEIDLRRHQESRHADLFAPSVTYTCPVEGCRHQHWPFVRKDKLQEHMRLNHTDFPQYNKASHSFESEELDPLKTRKQYQVEQYLAGEYMTGMFNDLVAFPARNLLPGENLPFLHSNGRVTTSSRGRGGGIRKPTSRRPSGTVRNPAAIVIPPRPTPSSQAPDLDWSNASVSAGPNDMRFTYSTAPSPFVQGSPLAPGFDALPSHQISPVPNANMSMSFGTPYGQQTGQFFAQPTAPVNLQDGYNQYGTQGIIPQNQQGFGSPYTFQNAYPTRQFVDPRSRRGPQINVRAPTFNEADNQTTFPSPFTPSPIAESPMLDPFSSPMSPYPIQGQTWGIANHNTSRNQQRYPQSNVMQPGSFSDSWMADDAQSNSISSYEVVSRPSSSSMSFSPPMSASEPLGSGTRRLSRASPHHAVNQGFSLSRPPTPAMDVGGPSSSSDASPNTIAGAPNLASSGDATEGFGDGDEGKYTYESADTFGELVPDADDLYTS